MSDPASNVGIEDVLASVRRLVSAERQAHEAVLAPGDQPAGEGADNVDALVLTADLRIVQSDAKTQKNGAAVADAGRDAAASADLDGISAKPSGVVPTPAATLTRGKADRDAPRRTPLRSRVFYRWKIVSRSLRRPFRPTRMPSSSLMEAKTWPSTAPIIFRVCHPKTIGPRR